MLKNKKGMTLIEIVISLLIASIVLLVVGSMIVSSLGFFRDTSTSDQDKHGLNEISNFVSSELQYSTSVTVSKDKPEGSWHSISINSDGHLLRDGKKVYSDDYYDGRKLQIKVKALSDYRLDMKYIYLDKTSEVFTVRDTLEFANLTLNGKEDDNLDFFSNISKNYVVLDTQNTIYYKKDFTASVRDGDTAVDYLSCINAYNDRGVFNGKTLLNLGDVVYEDGEPYQLIYSYPAKAATAIVASKPSNTSRWFRKLTIDWDEKSGYLIGDIVSYNEQFYICIKEITNDLRTYTPANTDSWNHYFDPYSGNNADMSEICNGNNSFVLHSDSVNTILKELYDDNNNNLSDIEERNSTKSYSKGNYIKVTDSNGNVTYYMSVFDGNTTVPRSNNNKWKEISFNYQATSCYEKDDIVGFYYESKGIIIYAKVNKDILYTNTSANSSMFLDQCIWEIVNNKKNNDYWSYAGYENENGEYSTEYPK